MSIITTKEQRELRESICTGCAERVMLFGRPVCGKCKCPLSGKVLLTNSKCPLNKWPILG